MEGKKRLCPSLKGEGGGKKGGEEKDLGYVFCWRNSPRVRAKARGGELEGRKRRHDEEHNLPFT